MPDRPQPIRALALALAERAKKESAAGARRDLKRAITLLNQIITTPWDEAYDGIEMIALMEVNQLIPRLQALGVANTIVDPRLVASLDVDLRVLIEWNTAATDLDLWGGGTERRGRDVQQRQDRNRRQALERHDVRLHGPEEYLLRRAPDGRFEISVNVYASDQLNPNGKTTVSAQLTHRFWPAGRAHRKARHRARPKRLGSRPARCIRSRQGGELTDVPRRAIRKTRKTKRRRVTLSAPDRPRHRLELRGDPLPRRRRLPHQPVEGLLFGLDALFVDGAA